MDDSIKKCIHKKPAVQIRFSQIQNSGFKIINVKNKNRQKNDKNEKIYLKK